MMAPGRPTGDRGHGKTIDTDGGRNNIAAWIGSMKGECKWYRLCPVRRYVDLGALDARWVEDYCLGDWNRCEVRDGGGWSMP